MNKSTFYLTKTYSLHIAYYQLEIITIELKFDIKDSLFLAYKLSTIEKSKVMI